MTILTARHQSAPSDSVLRALGPQHAALCGFINKYESNIPIIIDEAGRVIKEAFSRDEVIFPNYEFKQNAADLCSVLKSLV